MNGFIGLLMLIYPPVHCPDHPVVFPVTKEGLAAAEAVSDWDQGVLSTEDFIKSHGNAASGFVSACIGKPA